MHIADAISYYVSIVQYFKKHCLIFSSKFVVAKLNSNISVQKPAHVNACFPNPCGPNSQCREGNGQAICSCLPNYIGEPPSCKPECLLSSDCASNKACINQKCVDPCPGPCGQQAECRVFNHNPICSCRSGFTGDPFTRCFSKPGTIQINVSKHSIIYSYHIGRNIYMGLFDFSTATTTG